MRLSLLLTAPLAALVLLASRPAQAQSTAAPTTPDADQALVPSEPDFTLAALPSGLRTPAGKFVFRMTHRFTRPLNAGTAGDLVSSFFGFDSAAKIGIEARYGLWRGGDLTLHRTNDRTVQLLTRQEIWRSGMRGQTSVTLLAGVDGRNNLGLSEELGLPGTGVWTGSAGAILARRFGDRGTIYFEPIGVFNASVSPLENAGDQHTMLAGIGARWRLGATSRTYLIVEAAPRVAGRTTGAHHVSVAIEKRAGGHMFQLNVSNTLATTLGQIGRGGETRGDWFIGFNLTRRFF